ncbi:UNVERIFIED_CONTAM: hypothetical protein Slati_2906300 [Sesamum latifolium]|uniref:Uncharacterized protein n=1 Tax=Sesamum latifolium TaxID=2727402 RepID=A0AAW2VCF2_9LAMI
MTSRALRVSARIRLQAVSSSRGPTLPRLVIAAPVSARAPSSSKGGSRDLNDSDDIVILFVSLPAPPVPPTAIIAHPKSNPGGERGGSPTPGAFRAQEKVDRC